MDRLIVTGGRRLVGAVRINGAKNSALKLMAASLLAEGRTVIENVPRIVDCVTMGEVLERLGAAVGWDRSNLTIDTDGATGMEAPYELVRKMRASIIVLGPLLARYGHGRVAMPGGCNIGSRKIDLHLKGLERMSVEFSSEHGYLEAKAPNLHGAFISLDFPSVGATENILMAAVGARGATVIEIEGVESFRPVRHAVVPDRIEAGTFAIAVCMTGGEITLQDALPAHLDLVLDKLTEAGGRIAISDGNITVGMDERPLAVDFVTLPYPGFPTDLQPQMMALLSIARGTSIITENVFESRFMFVDELNRMGADIRTEGHHAVIRGVERLSAAPVRALDIRAGAAVVIAALAADGQTEIFDLYHVDRGYQDFDGCLAALGAEVRREPEPSFSPAL